MTEITVIKKEEDVPLSREEREILYHELSSQMKIPYYYFEQIGILEDEDLAKELQSKKSDIFILNLRNILRYPCLIPIGRTYNKKHELREGSAEKSKKPKKQKKTKKKPIPKEKPVAITSIEPAEIIRDVEKEQIIDIMNTTLISERTQRMDKFGKELSTIYALPYNVTNVQRVMFLPDILDSEYKDFYSLSNGDELDVCGIAIIPDFPLKKFYVDDVPNSVGIIGRLKSGYYSYEYVHHKLFVPYVANKFYESNLLKMLGKGTGIKKDGGIYYILFRNEEHAKVIVNLLFGLFLYFSNRWMEKYISMFLELVNSKKSFQNPSSLYEYLSNVQEDEENVKEIEKPDKPTKEDKVLQKYLEQFQPCVTITFSDKVPLIYDMSASGLLAEWMLLKYLSISDEKNDYEKRLEESIENMTKKLRKALENQTNYAKKYEEAYLELEYRWIFIKKFGYHKYREIIGKEPKSTVDNLLYRNSKKILDEIGKGEKSIVLIEKEKSDKYFQAMQNNRSPWVEIARKLQNSQSVEERRKLYHELKKYLPSSHGKPKDDWIRSKEGFPIICPHVKDQIEMELKGNSDKEIHDFLLKYAGEVPLNDAYYCRICGEPMTYTDQMEGISMFEGDQPIMMYHNSEDGINEFIWKQATQIVKGNIEFRDLKSNKYINQFIAVIVADLHDVIVLIDKKIRKAKTNNLEEIDGKRKLYTSIYIWAVLIKIILENKGKIKFTFQKDFQKVPSSFLFEKVLEKVLLTHDILLRELKDTNETHVKEALYAAYTNLNSILNKSKVETPSVSDDSEIFALDPIYWYFAWTYFLNSEKLDIKSWYKLTPEEVLGKDLNYENPKLKSIKPGNSLFSKYYSECYSEFIRYLTTRVYDHPVFDVSITKDINGLYTITTALNEQHKKYRESMAEIYKLQDEYLTQQRRNVAYAIGKLPFNLLRNYTSTKYVSGFPGYLLSRIYGKYINKNINPKYLPNSEVKKTREKFHKHKWNICLYCSLSDYDGYGLNKYKPTQIKSYDVSNSSVLRDLNASPEFEKTRIIDHICSICYDVLSTSIADKSSDTKDLLNEEQLSVSFFNYYQYRCPSPSAKQIKQGDISHVYSSEKCENCGATKEILTERDQQYFSKYIKVFQSTHIEKKIKFSVEFEPLNMKLSVSKYAKDWKPNTNVISEIVSKTYDIVSTQLKKNFYTNLWKNIGMVEDYEYDQILNGTEDPSSKKTKALVLMRVNRLDIYIKELMFDYYTLHNYKNLSAPPIYIKNIVDSSGLTELDKLGKLPKTLEPEYFSTLKEIKYLYVEDENKISEFLLEYFVQKILFVQSALYSVSKKFSNNFILYFIGKIIRMEKTSSKLKDQKAAAVEATQKMVDNNELNMQDHTESRSFDGLVPSSQADKYSYNEIDYDGENEDINT